jgi:hypothetical protein
MKKVPFSEIKKGEFFRAGGRALYQNIGDGSAQCVSGRGIGNLLIGSDLSGLVTPVTAIIVEEK